MSNLIPEKRVNKNGVVVTKHVKPAGAPSATKAGLPAPALPGAASKPLRAPSAESILKQMKQRSAELYGDNGDSIKSYGYELPHIAKFPASLRQGIYDFVKTADKHQMQQITDLFSHNYSSPNRFNAYINTSDDMRWIDECSDESSPRNTNESFQRIYEDMKLNRFTGSIDDIHLSYMKAEYLAFKLHLPPEDYSIPHLYYAEIETLRSNFEIIRPALPIVFAAMDARTRVFAERRQDPDLPQEERQYKPVTGEEIVDIAEWSQQYPDSTKFIADTIRERREFDRDMIDNMMTSGASAVASGVL